MMTQTNVVATDDVWGGMGLSEEAVQDVPRPSDMFKSQENPAATQAQTGSETPVDKELRLIKEEEFKLLRSSFAFFKVLFEKYLLTKFAISLSDHFSKSIFSNCFKFSYSTFNSLIVSFASSLAERIIFLASSLAFSI